MLCQRLLSVAVTRSVQRHFTKGFAVRVVLYIWSQLARKRNCRLLTPKGRTALLDRAALSLSLCRVSSRQRASFGEAALPEQVPPPQSPTPSPSLPAPQSCPQPYWPGERESEPCPGHSNYSIVMVWLAELCHRRALPVFSTIVVCELHFLTVIIMYIHLVNDTYLP